VVRNDHAHPLKLADARDAPRPLASYRDRYPIKEDVMAVAMMVDNPEGSQEIYEQIRAHLGLEKPAGGILHIAGPSPNGGWRVIEVWDSEDEAIRFFQERFVPALRELGIDGPPPPSELWPVHNAMR
jgi:hypothetical protein